MRVAPKPCLRSPLSRGLVASMGLRWDSTERHRWTSKHRGASPLGLTVYRRDHRWTVPKDPGTHRWISTEGTRMDGTKEPGWTAQYRGNTDGQYRGARMDCTVPREHRWTVPRSPGGGLVQVLGRHFGDPLEPLEVEPRLLGARGSRGFTTGQGSLGRGSRGFIGRFERVSGLSGERLLGRAFLAKQSTVLVDREVAWRAYE